MTSPEHFNVLPLICSSVSWRSTWQKRNTEYRLRANKSVKYEEEKSKNVSKPPDLAVLHFAQIYNDTPLRENIWKRRFLDQQSKQ